MLEIKRVKYLKITKIHNHYCLEVENCFKSKFFVKKKYTNNQTKAQIKRF